MTRTNKPIQKSVHVPPYYEQHVSDRSINHSLLCVNISWSLRSAAVGGLLFVYIPDEARRLRARPGITACCQRGANQLRPSDVRTLRTGRAEGFSVARHDLCACKRLRVCPGCNAVWMTQANPSVPVQPCVRVMERKWRG